MTEIVLDDPDYKTHIEQVLLRQRDFRVGTRVMVKPTGIVAGFSDCIARHLVSLLP